MVAIERKPEPPPETFLSRANGKTFEAVRRLLDRSGQRPCFSSSLLSDTEASALGVPPSVISSVQDLSRPLVDVLNRGGKGWRGYALAICCEIVGGDFERLEDWLAFSEILHAGSLIVDDVEDGAKTPARRPGLPPRLRHAKRDQQRHAGVFPSSVPDRELRAVRWPEGCHLQGVCRSAADRAHRTGTGSRAEHRLAIAA